MKLSPKAEKLIIFLLCPILLMSCGSVTTEIEDISEFTENILPETTWEETEMTETPKPSECSEFTVKPTDEFVRRLGRTTNDGDTLYASYSLSGIEFEIEGTLCDITLTTDGERFSDDRKAYAVVTRNDDAENSWRFRLEDGTHTYRIFQSETPQKVKLRLEKLSESAMASVGIEKIKTISYFEPTPTEEKSLKIQFVGDSITCAYGIEGADENSPFDTAEENPLIGFANLTAESLSADKELISWSGIGAVSCCTDKVGVKEDYVLIGDLYRLEDFNFDNVNGREPVYFVRENRQPDIVVVNIGTNDYFYTGDVPELVSEFGECYYDLLTEIRRQNPNADIICTLGVLGNQLMPEIERCAERFKEEFDENIYTLEFDLHDIENDGMGSKYHPSAKTHKKMADRLTEFILENHLNS